MINFRGILRYSPTQAPDLSWRPYCMIAACIWQGAKCDCAKRGGLVEVSMASSAGTYTCTRLVLLVLGLATNLWNAFAQRSSIVSLLI
nr:hypothetical protein CFP56_77020 [Quercus suber]